MSKAPWKQTPVRLALARELRELVADAIAELNARGRYPSVNAIAEFVPGRSPTNTILRIRRKLVEEGAVELNGGRP